MFSGIFCSAPEPTTRDIIEFPYEAIREALRPDHTEACFIPKGSSFFSTLEHLSQPADPTPPLLQKLEGRAGQSSLAPIFKIPFPENSGSSKTHGVHVDIPCFGPNGNWLSVLQPGPLDVLMGFIENDVSLINLMLTCRHVFARVHDHILWGHGGHAIRTFHKTYGHLAELVEATFSFQPVYCADVGIRTDVLLYARALPSASGHRLCFNYQFGYRKRRAHRPELPAGMSYDTGVAVPHQSSYGHRASASPRDRAYAASLCVNVHRRGSKRKQWLFMDKTRFHGDEFLMPTTSEVASCCVGDIVEVPLNIANSFGVMDITSFTWMPMDAVQKAVEEAPPDFSQSIYDQWVSLPTYRKGCVEPLESFNLLPLFKGDRSFCLGMDVAVLRQEVIAVQAGVSEEYKREFGSFGMVKPARDPIVVALRRLGLSRDRHTPLQYRVGDSITIFFMDLRGVSAALLKADDVMGAAEHLCQYLEQCSSQEEGFSQAIVQNVCAQFKDSDSSELSSRMLGILIGGVEAGVMSPDVLVPGPIADFLSGFHRLVDSEDADQCLLKDSCRLILGFIDSSRFCDVAQHILQTTTLLLPLLRVLLNLACREGRSDPKTRFQCLETARFAADICSTLIESRGSPPAELFTLPDLETLARRLLFCEDFLLQTALGEVGWRFVRALPKDATTPLTTVMSQHWPECLPAWRSLQPQNFEVAFRTLMASWNSRHNVDRLLLGLHCSLAAYVEVSGESSALLDTEIMGTVDLGTLSVTFLEGETGGEATYVEVPFHAASSLDVRTHPKSCVVNLVLENSRYLRDVVVSWTGSLNIVDSLPAGTELSLVLVIGITDERFENVMGFLGPLLRLPNISVKKQRTSLTTTKNIDGHLDQLSQQREQGEPREAPAKRVSFCRTKMVYEEVSTPEKDSDATQPPTVEASLPTVEAKLLTVEAKPPVAESHTPTPEAPAKKRRKKPKSKPKAKPSKKKSKVTKDLEQAEIAKRDSLMVSPEALPPTEEVAKRDSPMVSPEALPPTEEVAPTMTAMTLPFEDPPSERTPTERRRAASAPCSPSHEGGLLKRKRRRSIAGASQLLSSPDGIGTGSAQPSRTSNTNDPPQSVLHQEPPHVLCQELPQPLAIEEPRAAESKLKRHKPKSAVTKKKAPKSKAKKRHRTPTLTQDIIEEDTPKQTATVDQEERGCLVDEPFQELDIEAASPLSFPWKQNPQKRRPSMKTKTIVNLTPSDLRLSQKSPSHRTLSTEFLTQFTEEVLPEPDSEGMAWTQFLSEDEPPKVRATSAVGDFTPMLRSVVDALGNAFELKNRESLKTLRESNEADRKGLKAKLNSALSTIDDESAACIDHLEKEIGDQVKTFKRDIAVVLTQISEVYGTLEDIEDDDFNSHLSETKRSVEEVVNSLTRRLRKSFNPLDKSSIMQQIKDALGAV